MRSMYAVPMERCRVTEKRLRRWTVRTTVYATIGAAALFGSRNPALADTFDPSRPSASLLSVEQPSVTLSAGSGVSRTEIDHRHGFDRIAVRDSAWIARRASSR